MEQAAKKKIAVLNAKQFVSEISFNGQMITMEELDVSDESTTFPYIKAGSGKIIYSKYNFNSQSEEIIIYDAITKVKQVRLNNNVEHAMDLSFTYIINDIPYLLKKWIKVHALLILIHRSQNTGFILI